MKWLACLVLFIASPALAGPADIAVRVDFVEQRQVCNGGQCQLQWQCVERAYGSSTVVSKNETALAILTAAHVVRVSQQHPRAKIHVFFYVGDAWRPGVQIGEDVNVDLALFSVAYTGSIKPVDIAMGVAHNEAVYSRGYRRGKVPQEFVQRNGKLLTHAAGADGPRSIENSVYTTMQFAQGESGGGVFNTRGQLVAVIYGSDTVQADPTNHGLAANLAKVREFLSRHISGPIGSRKVETYKVSENVKDRSGLTESDHESINKSVDKALEGILKKPEPKPEPKPTESKISKAAKVVEIAADAAGKKSSGMSWVEIALTAALTASGIGIPAAWVIGGYRAAKLAKGVAGSIHEKRHPVSEPHTPVADQTPPAPPATPIPRQGGITSLPESAAIPEPASMTAAAPEVRRQIEIVRVPVVNTEAEMLKEAMARVARVNPRSEEFVTQVLRAASDLEHGQKVAQRQAAEKNQVTTS